jgi:protein-disulfide isomerase
VGCSRQAVRKELFVTTTRRDFIAGAAASAVGGAALSIAFVQFQPGFLRPAAAQGLNPELLKPSVLGDHVQGKEDAPVTIVEYASMTCGHCANFHVNTYPALKSRYIDTGKVRFIFREFPLDQLAAGAFMLARCAGKDDKDRYFALVDTLFHKQKEWVVQRPIPPLQAIAKQVGFTEASFEACLTDQKLLDTLEAERNRAAEKLGVNSTPTFFINGKIHRGSMTIEELEKQIEPFLKS